MAILIVDESHGAVCLWSVCKHMLLSRSLHSGLKTLHRAWLSFYP